jgi:hypothetical protein
MSRVVAAVVEDHIELAAGERSDAFALVGIAVALQFFKFREQPRARLAAIEERDGVSLCTADFDQRRAEESRASQDQDAEAARCLFLSRAFRVAGESQCRRGGQKVAAMKLHMTHSLSLLPKT